MSISTVIAILSIILSGLGAPGADNKSSPSAAEIIDRHIAAIGGKEALAKLKTRVAIGTVAKETEPAAQMSIMSEAPDRVAAVYVFRNVTWQIGYNGKPIYRPVVSGVGQDIAVKYNEVVSSGLAFNDISLYNLLDSVQPNGVKFEAKGTKKLNGRPAYVVEAKKEKGSAARLYFDADSFMWVRSEFGTLTIRPRIGQLTNDPIAHGEDDTTVEFYFETSDFRVVDGVKLPFKFVQVATAPVLQQKRVGTILGTITEYRHNIAIDPKMFEW